MVLPNIPITEISSENRKRDFTCLLTPFYQSDCWMLVSLSRLGNGRQGANNSKTFGNSLTPIRGLISSRWPAAHHPSSFHLLLAKNGRHTGVLEYGCMHDVPVYRQGSKIGDRCRDPFNLGTRRRIHLPWLPVTILIEVCHARAKYTTSSFEALVTLAFDSLWFSTSLNEKQGW